jgi:hypothetical protein
MAEVEIAAHPADQAFAIPHLDGMLAFAKAGRQGEGLGVVPEVMFDGAGDILLGRHNVKSVAHDACSHLIPGGSTRCLSAVAALVYATVAKP